MPIVPTREILQDAFSRRYGVAAFNVVNDVTLEAVVAAAVELCAPLIVQTSVKTVKAAGADTLYALFRVAAEHADVPMALHLDHCPDRAVLSDCLKRGWNSVLFDGSQLPSVEECKRQTIEVVAEARPYGADVEGEIEGIKGVEDGVGSDDAADIYSLETAVDFVRSTGVDIFAPAIGNAHGVYKSARFVQNGEIHRHLPPLGRKKMIDARQLKISKGLPEGVDVNGMQGIGARDMEMVDDLALVRDRFCAGE